MTPDDIITFWQSVGSEQWFLKSEEFDAEIRRRFSGAHDLAAAGRLADWAGSSRGSLALILLLDQFPRNMFRNDSRAFDTDMVARKIADDAIADAKDIEIELSLRLFIYLPFEHSEDWTDQNRAVSLISKLVEDGGDATLLTWANEHRDIIKRFGRFPHRNKVLQRTSRPDELAFLAEGGFAG